MSAALDELIDILAEGLVAVYLAEVQASEPTSKQSTPHDDRVAELFNGEES